MGGGRTSFTRIPILHHGPCYGRLQQLTRTSDLSGTFSVIAPFNPYHSHSTAYTHCWILLTFTFNYFRIENFIFVAVKFSVTSYSTMNERVNPASQSSRTGDHHLPRRGDPNFSTSHPYSSSSHPQPSAYSNTALPGAYSQQMQSHGYGDVNKSLQHASPHQLHQCKYGW